MHKINIHNLETAFQGYLALVIHTTSNDECIVGILVMPHTSLIPLINIQSKCSTYPTESSDSSSSPNTVGLNPPMTGGGSAELGSLSVKGKKLLKHH